MIDKQELSKLSPEERIKKLRQIEKDRKKEVDEIGKLIKESMQELKIGKIAEDVAPEQKAVDISRLFEANAEQGLERTARKEMPGAAPMKGAKGYHAIMETYDAYSKLTKLYGVVSMGGSLTEEQRAAIDETGARLNRAERYMTEAEKTASKLDASRAVLYKLKKESGLD